MRSGFMQLDIGLYSYLTSSELSVQPAQYHIIVAIVGMAIRRNISAVGRIFFHRQFIRISYRNRGSAPRLQINIIDTIVVLMASSTIDVLLVSIDIVNSLISRIFIYSAIKINANIDLLYSILNPETSSDSPSVKSSGARCVSAKIEINQVIAIGRIISKIQEY